MFGIFNSLSSIIAESRRPAGAGFTLIELLIAVAIFSLLTTFIVANYRVNDKIRSLRNQAQEVVTGLEEVENLALVGGIVDNQSPAAYEFSIANCLADCSYVLTAVFSDGSRSEIRRRPLNNLEITIKNPALGALPVTYAQPRGKMALPNSVTEASFQLANDAAVFCVRLNAVAGRVDLLSGVCP